MIDVLREKSGGIPLVIAAVCIVTCFSTVARAHEPVVIIVSADNPVKSLSLRQIRILYENGLIPWADGTRVTFYDLAVTDEARSTFSRTVLKQESLSVNRDWIRKKLTNTAINPPKTIRSALLLQRRVARDPGAVGYLLKKDLSTKGVRVIATIE